MAEVDDALHGTTELRIHGVSGTAPEAMLQFPTVRRVAGDRRSGFYRRWAPGGRTPDRQGRRLEAYSWGGLTSGGASRALWLLLLPFALVNLASWTEPGRPDQAPRRRRVLEALLRLFALSLTGSLVVAASSVSLDLLAWQCAVPQSVCADHNTVAGLLARLPSPGLRLAAAALVPAALVGLLWLLGNATWRRYESESIPDQCVADRRSDGEDLPDAPAASLQDARFWEGQAPVQRLRALHVGAAAAGIALLIAWPARLGPSVLLGRLATALAVAALAMLALCAVAVLSPRVADRRLAGREAVEPRWVWVPRTGYALLAVAATLTALAGDLNREGAEPVLPLVSVVLYAGFILQAGLLVVMTALNRSLPREPDPLVPIALGGNALPLLVSVGWLLAGGFSAGLSLRAAQWLGDPVAEPPSRILLAVSDPDRTLYVPQLYSWVGLVAAALALVVVPTLALAVWVRLRRLARRRQQVCGSGPEAARRRAIARIEDLAALTDTMPRYVAAVVAAACLLVVAAIVGWALDPRLPQRDYPGLTNFGSWAMGAVAMLLVGLGAAAYRTAELRRTIGILWDVASFWPRAVHPLAPPCYGERVLPELVNRAQALTELDDDRLLLSGHSQGSVIALATVLQLPHATARRTCLLTYGSPLTRLYGAYFPGYLNRSAYRAAAQRMGGPVQDSKDWPWRNLYRRSDPIGGWVLAEMDAASGTDSFDQRLIDPVFDRQPGDLAWPAALGHSDYWADPRFRATTGYILTARGAAGPAPSGASDPAQAPRVAPPLTNSKPPTAEGDDSHAMVIPADGWDEARDLGR